MIFIGTIATAASFTSMIIDNILIAAITIDLGIMLIFIVIPIIFRHSINISMKLSELHQIFCI